MIVKGSAKVMWSLTYPSAPYCPWSPTGWPKRHRAAGSHGDLLTSPWWSRKSSTAATRSCMRAEVYVT